MMKYIVKPIMSRLYYSKHREAVETPYKSLWDIAAKDIDGNMIDPLRKLGDGMKATLVVNVVSG